MAQIDGAGQQDTDNENAEALQAALAQREVTLQGQPQGGSDVPSHENSDPVSDESEILGSVSLLPENVVYRAHLLFKRPGHSQSLRNGLTPRRSENEIRTRERR